jgi:hypothetical protein
MEGLDNLRTLNARLCLHPCSEETFSSYGRVIIRYNFSALSDYAKCNAMLPENGVL